MESHEASIDGLPVRWHTAGDAPVLWVHGVPNSGEMWRPFLERAGGVAPDLPGFGRSGKPAEFGYSIPAYDAWIERFADHVGLERFALVVHDWGAAALAFAQRAPDRVGRLVIIDAVPLLPGYRWHRWARVWRMRVAGELAMGFSSPWVMRRALRGEPLPPGFVEEVFADFDQGTQRAILRLYRASPPATLAAAGARLGAITAPALVLWGERDRFVDPRFARAYADALPRAECVLEPAAGHWPWAARPGVVERVAAFVGA